MRPRPPLAPPPVDAPIPLADARPVVDLEPTALSQAETPAAGSDLGTGAAPVDAVGDEIPPRPEFLNDFNEAITAALGATKVPLWPTLEQYRAAQKAQPAVQAEADPLADPLADPAVIDITVPSPPYYIRPEDDPNADPFDREKDPETRGYLELIRDRPFGYLRGDAGTGKSYLARRYEELADDGLLVATTGIAAVNLGGTTINSALRYYDTASMQMEYEFGRLGAALGQLADQGIRRLIVDEISMMDGNQLDILALAVDQINERRAERDKDPIGIWLTGDFAQLPPVGADKRPGKGREKEEADIPTIYAFQAEHWSRWAENMITLKTVRRQADPEFIAAIQALRTGDKYCVGYFRQFIHNTEIPNFDGTTIMATNAEVDRYNALRLLRLQTKADYFRAVRTGDPKKFPGEWKNIPETLELKPGALVMILANRREPGNGPMIYANGDLATYQERMSETTARVTLKRTGQDVYVVSVLREKLDPQIPRTERRKEVIDPKYILGSIDYMPLRVAYASTVHKTQGLSLDSIQLLINSRFWMSSGMLYVGVSRARSPQGLRIVGSVEQFSARVRSNPIIQEWL